MFRALIEGTFPADHRRLAVARRGATMEQLLERMAALESTVQELQAQRQELREREKRARLRLRRWQAMAGALVLTALLLAPMQRVSAQSPADLQAQINALAKALSQESQAR